MICRIRNNIIFTNNANIDTVIDKLGDNEIGYIVFESKYINIIEVERMK